MILMKRNDMHWILYFQYRIQQRRVETLPKKTPNTQKKHISKSTNTTRQTTNAKLIRTNTTKHENTHTHIHNRHTSIHTYTRLISILKLIQVFLLRYFAVTSPITYSQHRKNTGDYFSTHKFNLTDREGDTKKTYRCGPCD